jgi:hypothetical protein
MVVITPILDVRHPSANHPPWVKTILLGPLLAIGLSIPAMTGGGARRVRLRHNADEHHVT